MPFLDELIQQSMTLAQQQQNYAAQVRGGNQGSAYASYFPTWEVQSPQHIVPSAYNMIREGFKANEFVYSIIGKRARAKAQAMLQVKQKNTTGKKSDDKDMPDHPLLELVRRPNPAPNMSESMFWQMKQATQDLAGFAAFEIEYNMLGEPIGLWYMTPFFCSFLRGQQQPLRAIRYQPFGLEPVDIPIVGEDGRQKILFFSNGEDFDPQYPGVKFWSPAMAALSEIQVDNAMTFFLNDFVKNGAKFAGLISVAQTIDESQAADYRRRWRAQHGGSENWADPLILGEGATYTNMQMNFKDMAFPELDARTESRICNAFGIDPIVAGAKAGLDISSYNNKEQAHKHWHYEWVIPSWRDDANAIGNQLLPLYETDPRGYYCDFDTSGVYSLQEDRDAQVKRAVDLFKAKLATKNEAREEFGAPPVDKGDDFAADAPPPLPFGQKAPEMGLDGKPMLPEDVKLADMQAEDMQLGRSQAEQDAADAEAKKFRAFARRRIKEGKAADLPQYEFKYLTGEEQRELLSEFGRVPLEDAEQVIKALAIAARAAAEIESIRSVQNG